MESEATNFRLARPVMVFDGDCAFCRRWIGRWHRATAGAIEYQPYQEVAGRFGQVSRGQFEKAVYLIEPQGRISSGAEAALRSLALAGRWRSMLWLYDHVPFVAQAAEAVYRFVARHRGELDRLEPRT